MAGQPVASDRQCRGMMETTGYAQHIRRDPSLRRRGSTDTSMRLVWKRPKAFRHERVAASATTTANMRKVICVRQQDQKERDEQETLLDAYLQAVAKPTEVGKAA
jgi:hypothetical protein